jgi:endonuclease/exonuclease/phosphatase family metal-dependent hydrolase
MKFTLRRLAALTTVLASFLAAPVRAQIEMSAGSYIQNFDSLATSSTSNPWTNNSTLPGWYASKTSGGATVSSYRAESGTSTTGALYSFGVTGVSNLTDRALGSVASGTPGNFAYGIRFTNDTSATVTNILVSYTGEQWRNSGNASPQTLSFSYRISGDPITNADAANVSDWTSFAPLDFATPTVGGTATALDGNVPTNRQEFLNVLLTDVSIPGGEELFLRWRDVDDASFDHGLGVDDLTVVFNSDSNPPPVAPFILTQPASRSAFVGDQISFGVVAGGNPAPTYQWLFNGTNIADATNALLTLASVTTDQGGEYRVIIANSEGSTNSDTATLTVSLRTGVSLLTYNVKGNGATDWSTNSPQLHAIARELQYLQPDVITFNEIPYELRYEMTNFIAAFLPAYQIAISSGTDGSICSAIASRYAITQSHSWLPRIDLRAFGYSNVNDSLDNFTRDLFEAQIAVPDFPRPLHVFTTHLKSTGGTTYAEAAAKRAAEAASITNFFATNLFVLYPYDPYTLSGDMNDSDTNALAIQTLISPATGLTLTEPENPFTGSINTYSTVTANPGERIDFIFPSQLLLGNVRTGLVFRTDRLSPLPPDVNSNDCKIASDHLPVLLMFNNPYDKPFKLLSLTRTDSTLKLQWESVPGQPYSVAASTNLNTWSTLASNLVATATNFSFSTNVDEAASYFQVRRDP